MWLLYLRVTGNLRIESFIDRMKAGKGGVRQGFLASLTFNFSCGYLHQGEACARIQDKDHG